MLPSLSLEYNPTVKGFLFVVSDLPENESIKLRFEQLNVIDDFRVESSDGDVFGQTIIIEKSKTSVSGEILLKYEDLKVDYLSVSVIIEIKTDIGYSILSIAASGCDIPLGDKRIDDGIDILIDREFINIDESSGISISTTPNVYIDIKINDKTFKVKMNSSGRGHLSVNPVQVCDSYQINSNQVLRFPVQYRIGDGSNFINTGKKIHFIPDKIKALQSTNSDGVPDCVILDPNADPSFIFKFEDMDKPGYSGPIVGPLYNIDGTEAVSGSTVLSPYTHAKSGNVSVFSDGLIGGFDPSFISSNISIAKKTHEEEDPDGAFIRFAFSAVDSSANFPESGELSLPNNASRVVVGSTLEGQSYNTLGVNRGMIIKPSVYYHSVTIGTSISPGDVFAILVRFSDGSFVEKILTAETSDLTLEIDGFIYLLNGDDDFVRRGISATLISGRIDLMSDSPFNILKSNIQDSSSTNIVSSIALNTNATIDMFVSHSGDKQLLEDATYILFFDERFRGVMFEVVSYENSIIRLSLSPGYNRVGGFSINDDISCLEFIAISGEQLSGHGSSNDTEALPYVMIDGSPVSALSPQISSSGRVICAAAVNDKLQLFFYSPNNDPQWIQLTHVGENKNPKIVEDKSGSIHLVWESDRGGKVQLYYTCIGASSRMFANLVIDNLLARVAESDSDNSFLSLTLESDLDIMSDGSYSIIERETSSQQILLGGHLESDDDVFVIQEFIGPSPFSYDSVILNSVGDDHLFNNNENVLPYGIDGFSGFDKNDFISSVYVHADPIGPVSYEDGDWESFGGSKDISFSFKSNYKIIGVSYTNSELNSSDSFFAPNGYQYEASRSVEGLSYVINFNSDMMGFSASLSFDGNASSQRVAGIRIYLSIPHGDIFSSEIEDWYRFASSDGECSVEKKDKIVVDFNPLKSASSAVSILNKDEYGDYFDGMYHQLGYQVGFDFSMSLSDRGYAPIKSSSVGADIFNSINSVVDFSTTTPVPSNVQNIIIYNEFYGPLGFYYEEKDASDFTNDDLLILNIDGGDSYFSEIDSEQDIFSCYVHIKPEDLFRSFDAKLEFDSTVLGIMWKSDDLLSSDSYVYNERIIYGVQDRGIDNVDSSFNIKLNKDRNILSLSSNFNQIPGDGVGFRVILDGNSVKEELQKKTTSDIRKKYRKFKSGFQNWSVDVFEKFNNRYTLDHIKSKFDSLIPIFGSMKFDILSSNPLSEESSEIESNQIIQLINNPDNNRTISSVDTIFNTDQYYDIPPDFKIDRAQTPLHHYLICLIPEVDYFEASNVETFSEYCIRMSQAPSLCKDYSSFISERVFTGRFRIGVMASTKESMETNDQSRKRYKLVHTTSRVFDLSSNKNIIVSANYVKQSAKSLDRIASYGKAESLIRNSIIDDERDISELKEDFRWMLDLQVLVNGKIGLSESFYVDMSSIRRQFDLSFGCPVFGKYISEETTPFNGLEMSDVDLRITYDNVRVGSNLIKFNNQLIDVGGSHRSLGSIAYYGYLGESLTHNDSFEFSILDPYSDFYFGLGDYQPLPEGSFSISEWDVINGGAVYLGSYYRAHHGSRSILLESVNEVSEEEGGSEADYDSWTYLWSRNNYIGTGYGGGISQTLNLEAGEKYIFRIVISCRPYSPESNASLSFNKTIDISINGTSNVYDAPQFYGDFNGSATDDYVYKTITFGFTSSGTDLVEITNSTLTPDDDDLFLNQRGGIIVDQVNVFKSEYEFYENHSVNEYDMYGVSQEEYENSYYINAVDRIPQIPITFNGINKSHDLYLDDFGKLHLAWQSNRDGDWNIYYSSSRITDLIFREEVKITETSSFSSSPSVCADSEGERIIVWHDNRDGDYQIYSANSNLKDIDYVDPCEFDRYAYVSSLIPEVDPYDPYSYFIDDLSCKLKFNFTPEHYGDHRFKILLYEDKEKTKLKRAISSVTNTSGWYVNDVPIISSGHYLQQGTSYDVEYVISYEDDVVGQSYYVDFYIESNLDMGEGFGSVNTSSSEGISYRDSFSSIDLSGLAEIESSDVSVGLIREFVGPSKISYPPKGESDFVLVNFDEESFQSHRLQLEDGTVGLRGFGFSENIASFIVHLQPEYDSGEVEYSIKIDFENPILAIIPYSSELEETDLTLGNSLINYSSAESRGSLEFSTDFISITDDMKTINMNISATSDHISQVRIVTGGVSRDSYSVGSTAFYCPHEQSPRCNANVTYTNVSDETKNVGFRVTAFSDSSLKDVILSQYSGYDSTSFRYGLNKIPYSGVEINPGQTVNVSYDPSFMSDDGFGWAKRTSQEKVMSSEFFDNTESWSCVSVEASGYNSSQSSSDISHRSRVNGTGFIVSDIYQTNEDVDELLYWQAPVKFFGQKAHFINGKIIIRVAQLIDDGLTDEISPSLGREYMDDIILEDIDGSRISTSFPQYMSSPDGDFIRYEIPLSNSQGWRNAYDNSVDGGAISNDAIRNVLLNLKGIYIRAEYFNSASGTTSNSIYLDEVTVIESGDDVSSLPGRYRSLACGVPYYFKVDTIDIDLFESFDSSFSGGEESAIVFAVDSTLPMEDEELSSLKFFINNTVDKIENGNHSLMCGVILFSDSITASVDPTYDYDSIRDVVNSIELTGVSPAYMSAMNKLIEMYGGISNYVSVEDFYVVFVGVHHPLDAPLLNSSIDSGGLLGKYFSVAYLGAADENGETLGIIRSISDSTGGGLFLARDLDEMLELSVYENLIREVSSQGPLSANQYIIKSEIINVMCACGQVGINSPRRLTDSNSWSCSGSGLDDTRITKTSRSTINPTVSPTKFGYFYIAWEDYRHSIYESTTDEISNMKTVTLPQIYGSLFNKSENKVYGSANGISDIQFLDPLADTLYPEFSPKILTDNFQNMVIFSRGAQSPYVTYSSVGLVNVPAGAEDDALVTRNLLDSTNLPDTISKPRSLGDLQYETIRLTGSSVAYTTYLTKDTPISVIDDCFVTLDVLGIPGTYAVRIKNENDPEWSEWMSISNDVSEIDGNAPGDELNTFRAMFSARFVDTDRFSIPWMTSGGNGFKRVCCEVLTFFGRTRSFCLDFYATYKPLRYSIDLYYDSGYTKAINKYKGYPVISSVGYDNQITETDLSSIAEPTSGIVEKTQYYGRLTFHDIDRLKKLESIFDGGFFSSRFVQENFISCEIYQQGSSVDEAESVTKVDGTDGEYAIVFNIKKSDGVLYRDGIGVAKVTVAGQCLPVVQEITASEEKRILGSDLFEDVSVNGDQSSFIEKYNKDDLYNSFGNKEYYSNSFYGKDGSILHPDKVKTITDRNEQDTVDFGSLM